MHLYFPLLFALNVFHSYTLHSNGYEGRKGKKRKQSLLWLLFRFRFSREASRQVDRTKAEHLKELYSSSYYVTLTV